MVLVRDGEVEAGSVKVVVGEEREISGFVEVGGR